MSEAAVLTPPATILFPPANVPEAADVPWVPLSPGFSIKPLRFFREGRGYTALLRLEPGTVIPPHRHTGDVHAINLEGRRELVTGEVIGPGGYVYEPPGNVDTWRAVGDEVVIVFVVLTGGVDYLTPEGAVAKSTSAVTLEATYRAHCAALGVAAVDLSE